ncbi:hypothetical protein [Micromonospora sp. NPDC050200]|uniref:hypothetical protein n=1 Tax=Micromonospora sp. NPDC050200 TaxID=3155664 RepID=UPI0033C2C1AE
MALITDERGAVLVDAGHSPGHAREIRAGHADPVTLDEARAAVEGCGGQRIRRSGWARFQARIRSG